MDRSISFYQSLGMMIKSRWGDHYAQLGAPGLVIGLHPTRDTNLPGNSGNAFIGFIAEDLDETRSLLQELSIPITERKEEGGEFLHFTDPDGTALYFMKPKW